MAIFRWNASFESNGQRSIGSGESAFKWPRWFEQNSVNRNCTHGVNVMEA